MWGNILFPTSRDFMITSPTWSCQVLGLALCHSRANFVRKPIKIGFIDTGLNINLKFMKSYPTFERYNVFDQNNDVTDNHGHGTMVVSVFLDTINRIEAQTGVLLPIEIVPVKSLGKDGKNTSFSTERGFLYMLTDPDIDVINMSMDSSENDKEISGYQQTEHQLLDYGSRKRKALLVVAAGNYKKNLDRVSTYPCSYQTGNMICVGNMTDPSIRTSTNFGFEVDTLINGENIRVITNTGGYNMVNGTSFSAPQISAYIVYGLFKYPKLSRDQIKQSVIESVSEKKLCLYAKSCGVFNFIKFQEVLKIKSLLKPDLTK